MLRGFRSIVTTLAGLAIVASALWALVSDLSSVDSAYRHSASDASVEYQRNAQAYIKETCFTPAGLGKPDCAPQAREAAREGQRKEQDLAAQNITAWWTKVMGIAALMGMALSAVGVWLVKTTFDETREANSIARDAQRAWITIESDPILVRPSGPDGLYVRVNFTAKNVGGTAATDFEFTHEIIFHRKDETSEDLDKRCVKIVGDWVNEWGEMQFSTLVPGGTEASSIWQAYEGDKIHWFSEIPGGALCTEITLLSAVVYKTPTKPNMKQISWRSWYLCHINEKGVAVLRIPKGRQLSQADLQVEAFRTSLVHEERTANDGSRHQGQ